MKHWKATFGVVLVISCVPPSRATEVPTPPDLPSTEQARAAIEQDPVVVQARHALEAAGHSAAMLQASPYEWTARGSVQQRRYDAGGTSNEWSAQLERTVRLGGKAGLDRELGQTGIRQARARLGEARHEAAQTIAELWLDWLAAVRAKEVFHEQLGFADANNRAVQMRRKAGDASVLELNVAKADSAEIQRQLSAATANVDKARARLRGRFPQLILKPPSLSEPVLLEGDEAQWLERIAAESDLLRTAQENLRTAELTAARAKANRTPDPTLGIHAASEAFSNERVLGLSISIPLTGTYRDAAMREALQQIEVARADYDRQRRELGIEVAVNFTEARGSMDRWRLAEEAAAATRESARLSQRAYTLGELDLQSLLLVRRQSVEALNAAASARADTLRARYRLLIDAHRIWGLEED